MIPTFRIPLALVALCLAGLAGCSSTPTDTAPQPIALPAIFSESPEAGDIRLTRQWWQHFDDSRLDEVVAAAVDGSFTLASARARLRQARASARIAGADQLPTLDANADAGVTSQDGSRSENYRVGASASYEVDLWGRIGAGVEAARLEAQATESDLDAAYISLTASTADTFYRVLRQRAIVDLLDRQRLTNEQVADLISVRYRNGQAQFDELLRQRRLAEASVSDLLSARATLKDLRHQLAALMGQPANTLALPAGTDITELPPMPEVGLPSQWLNQRPDLRAAWQRVQSADADVAVAIAEQYPRLDLTASLETAATSPSDLFEDWVSSLAAGLAVPIFRGGALEAEVDRSTAVRDAAFNDYAQTVVDAVAEVETALSNAHYDRERLISLNRQLTLAEEVVERLRQRYIGGAAEYLDVLSALTTLQSVQRQQLEAQWALLLDRIVLIRTIAGGWDTAGPEASEANG